MQRLKKKKKIFFVILFRCCQKLVQAGLLQSLISLIHWTDQKTRQRCIVAMCSLADGQGMRSRLVDEGAVPALISLLSSHDMTMRRDCVRIIIIFYFLKSRTWYFFNAMSII